MESHEYSLRYQGIELGQKVYVANHLQSRVERAIVSGVSLKLCADGVTRAEYYTLRSQESGEPLLAVYPTEIFDTEMGALTRLVKMLDNELLDSQSEQEEVREAKVRAKMRMAELEEEKSMEGTMA